MILGPASLITLDLKNVSGSNCSALKIAAGFDVGLVACRDECADKAMQYAANRDIKLQRHSEATLRLKMLRA